MGGTSLETAIAALANMGVPKAQIAARLGISSERVRRIRSRVTVNLKHEEAAQAKLREQTRKLGKAVRAEGGHR